MSFNSLRPGVYSEYQISAHYATPRSAKAAGLIAKSPATLAGELYTIENSQQLGQLFEGSSATAPAYSYCQLLLDSGVSKIYFYPVQEDSTLQYAKALTALEKKEDVGILFSGTVEQVLLSQALASVEKSSQEQRERLLFLGASSVKQAVALATELNHERCVITLGTCSYAKTEDAFFAALALGGKILSENHPMLNLNGLSLPLLEGMTKALTEQEVQSALASGVTPLELAGEAVQCVRGVTTRTKTGDVKDYTFRSVNTTLVVDDVLTAVREGLKARLRGANLVATSLDSIASQVMVELSEKREAGLLADFNTPRVYSDPADPEVCIVELSFQVAHVISQIHIKAFVRL